MPYTGMQFSNYAAGDYYAYQAGGFFGAIGKALGGVAKVAGKVLPGPIGVAATAVGGILSPGKKNGSVAGTGIVPYTGGMIPMMAPPSIPVPRGTPGAVPTPGVTGIVQRILPGGASGYTAGAGGVPGMPGYHLDKKTRTKWVRNRSMNPGNARALRRSIRRQSAFVAMAKRALAGSGYTFKRTGAPKTARRRKR